MKKLIVLLSMVVMAVSLTACGTTYQEATEQIEFDMSNDYGSGYFTAITKWGDGYQIVYANDTKVKYLIVDAGYHFGITPLYNADGTLQIYDVED